MSIEQFHSQLMGADERDALMGTLRRLSAVEDPGSILNIAADMIDWVVWDNGGGPPPR